MSESNWFRQGFRVDKLCFKGCTKSHLWPLLAGYCAMKSLQSSFVVVGFARRG